VRTKNFFVRIRAAAASPFRSLHENAASDCGPALAETNTNINKMIKTLTVLVIASALTITANAHPGGKGKRGQRGQIPAELLQKYDKNNDGTLDEAERAVVNEEDKANLGGHHGKGRGKGAGKGGPGAGKPAAN
jgi:hypothetical protein